MSKTYLPTRRSVLTKVAHVGAAALLPSLRPGRADAATVPTRVIFFWVGSGVPRQVYKYTSAGGGAPTMSDFVFPEVRSPLNAIKNQLITFDGLEMTSNRVDKTPPGNGHYDAETHSLSGATRASPEVAGGPSIDQYIAKQMKTAIPSLSLASQCDGNVSFIKVCTSGPGSVVPLNPSARDVYTRLTKYIAPGATSPTPSTGQTPEQLAAEQRSSVLNLVLENFASVKSRLPMSEQTKLDAHAQAVRDLERRLGSTGNTGGDFTAGAACKDPTTAVLKGAGNAYPGDPAMYKANYDAMTRIVQVALACDITRVVLLTAGEPFGSDWGYTSGNWGTSDSHDLIHKTSINEPQGTLKGNGDAMAAVTRLHQFEAKQYLALLDLLRQTPESDGKTLLDHTIVLWCSQIGEHGHHIDELPWLIGGGSAAGFTPGRFLKLPRNAQGWGTPHNNLFVSIAQAMGVQTNTFGNPDVCTGPLAGLRV